MSTPCNGCNDSVPSVQPEIDTIELGVPLILQKLRPKPGEHPLSIMGKTLLPDTKPRQFQRAVFNKDGSIEFPKLATDTTPPDDIDGYERDKVNPWLFRPVWLDCSMRLHGAKLKESGSLDIIGFCQEKKATTFNQYVKCETCKHCSVRTS